MSANPTDGGGVTFWRSCLAASDLQPLRGRRARRYLGTLQRGKVAIPCMEVGHMLQCAQNHLHRYLGS